MNLDTDLAQELDRAIPHLPAAPATAYLTSGRRARRRRRAYAGVAGVAVLALTGGATVSLLDDPSATTVIGGPATSSPGLDDQIPSWAQEYGNHGPVSIYPDGELWVAPDARLIRSVEIPANSFEEDMVSAYAAEAEIDGQVWWSFVFRTSHSPSDRPAGQMELAREWTTDFDVWVDYITADMQGRQRFSERLVEFADGSSERLVARPGAQIIDQTDDVVLPNWENHPRTSVAKVTYADRTWFVIASGPRSGQPFYTPFQAEVVSASNIDGFLDYLRDLVGEGE
jgi:hypothetical protein